MSAREVLQRNAQPLLGSARGRIEYEAPAEVREILASIGRTEDVKLSPDNRWLAIAGFSANEIYLFSIAIDGMTSPPAVRLRAGRVLRSAHLAEPHGLTFVGNEHLLVCNRAADVCIFRLADVGIAPRTVDVVPVAVLRGRGALLASVKTPGSADCFELAPNLFRVLVCNNHWNFVSSHDVSVTNRLRVRHRGAWINDGLRLPDGLSVSRDKAWVAVNNHVDGEVLVYAYDATVSKASSPVAVLSDLVCPHGIRFTSDGRILVADAASEYIHVFDRGGDEWHGTYTPTRSVRMLDKETFFDGRHDFREGGIKGLEIDRTDRVLITSHRIDVLGFYDLEETLKNGDVVDPEYSAALRRERDQALNPRRRRRLANEWRLRPRAWHAARELRQRWRDAKTRARTRGRALALAVRHRVSGAIALDPSGPVVSLTTHGERIHCVHYAIESIVGGIAAPSRILLWLTDPALWSELTPSLRRLQARGLEIHLTDEYGPHSKYYPYVLTTDHFDRPLVTADDDAIYSDDWLQRLAAAYEADPDSIHCWRARRMAVAGSELTPYASWPTCRERGRHRLNFITGVAGVVYPPGFLRRLKVEGDAFLQCCPDADDVWLTLHAIRGGFEVSQLEDRPLHPITIPGSQTRRLFDLNVGQGMNQVQLRRSFTERDVALLGS
jgi:hypothetical protein